MKKKTKIAIFFWIIVLIIFIIFLIIPKKGLIYRYTLVKFGDIIQEVSAIGTVVSQQELDLEFKYPGKVKEIKIDIGDKVNVNQILAVLEQDELNLEILQKQAGLEAAQARLEKVLAGTSPEEIKLQEIKTANARQNLEDIKKQAEQNLKQAQEKMDDILNEAYVKAENAVNKQTDEMFENDFSSSPKLTFTITDSQAEIDVKWQRYLSSLALNDFNNTLKSLITIRDFLNRLSYALSKTTGLPQSQLDIYYNQTNTALTNVNSAIFDFNSQQQIIDSIKVKNLLDINSARSNLESAQYELALKKIEPRKADVSLYKAEIKQAQAALLAVQNKINDSFLRAPISGIITNIDYSVGEISGIISMIDKQDLQIETYVPETDIGKIKTGDLAEIILDAFESERWKGKVISIEPGQRIIDGVVYYKIIILFKPDSKIKTGMTADVNIKTQEKKNVLYIPQRAIKGNKVKILEGQEIKEKRIKTGLIGIDSKVEILDGLEQGDKVIIFIKE